MEIQIAIAKVNQYQNLKSGDSIEAIERPNEGITAVISSGIQADRSSKSISLFVAKKVISLIADGVRDSAAARAASDSLYTEYKGLASAALTILSVDLQTNTVVLTCNSHAPIFIARNDSIEKLSTECALIGHNLEIRPSVSEIPIESGITIATVSIGFLHAGIALSQQIDIKQSLSDLFEDQQSDAKELADCLLLQAIRLDQNQPNNDMSVIILKISSSEVDQIRRMSINIPISQIES
jgi:serine phosphatase RsbU (regulator of sigma subunit)